METYAVIMAGGGGTRFWPLSRQKRPKQLLNLSGRDLMINETADRLQMIVAPEHTYIVTNQNQYDLMLQATKGKVPAEQILSEPASRNTAACIGYAAIEIIHRYGDGVMCITPSDHNIKNEAEELKEENKYTI